MARMRKSATKMDGRRSGKTRAWSKADHRELKRHSKAKTHVFGSAYRGGADITRNPRTALIRSFWPEPDSGRSGRKPCRGEFQRFQSGIVFAIMKFSEPGMEHEAA
jgi:hypothetical protein